MPNKLIAWIYTALFLISTVARGGDTSGNGGDPLRFLFLEAKGKAAQLVWYSTANNLPMEVAETVREWIIKNRELLAEDISKTEHVWLDHPTPTCARTERATKATVFLSFPSCRGLASLTSATKLLIHESVHHFGIEEEAFADAVAEAIFQAATLAKNMEKYAGEYWGTIRGPYNKDVPKHLNLSLTVAPSPLDPGGYKITGTLRFQSWGAEVGQFDLKVELKDVQLNPITGLLQAQYDKIVWKEEIENAVNGKLVASLQGGLLLGYTATRDPRHVFGGRCEIQARKEP